MPLKTRKFKDDELIVCYESFSSGDPELGGCARGTRLRGDHPKVVKWPQFFVRADTPDDELRRLRVAMYEAQGVSLPPTG
jgi:hypothetical protein